MNVEIISQENGMAQVSVSVPGEDLTQALDRVFARHQTQEDFSIPRQGADTDPAARSLLQEAVQELFSGIYEPAIRKTGLTVASEPKVTVVRADETGGAEFVLEFALRPELRLGRYKGIHVKMPEITPTEEEYQQALRQVEGQNYVPTAVDRPAKTGDITRIDFEGFLDGVAFPGGKGEDFALTLGSGQFIPGFEAQLEGASAGDQVEVHVTFPEQYHAANLAGKPAVFQVTVKEVLENRLTPMTQEQQDKLRESVAQRKKDQADQDIEDQVLRIILEEAQVALPEAMVESEENICLQQFMAELSAKGMDFETFCRQTGKTRASILQEMEPLARRRIQLRLVLEAIAQAEGLKAEESEVEAAWNQMAEQYGMSVQQIRQYAGPETDAAIRADIANQKAYALLRESTILERE